MNILITNDDGISSQGILALEKILGKEHDTFLIAPLKEKSAKSMALSIYDSLRVEKINSNHYIVDGYPVDCVNIGIHGNIFPKIDLVISGINRGVNMGYDVHYSGTVGAARHAAIHNIRGMAVSSGNSDKHYDYMSEAELVRDMIRLWKDGMKPGTVYNVNIPTEFRHSTEDVEIVRLGKRTYVDTYHSTPIIGDIAEFYLGGSDLGFIPEPDTDFEAFYKGKVTLTPLSLDQTDSDRLAEFKRSIGLHSQ
ncbi:5'/3'-nucleotidase SurE [Leptospira fluminis]|uniref:5'-nucleotidase SurE n=1 Tax=Leptospira fluminis TaxID=2484979 RepID=A0A4R9GRH7_9LEPT|nr:5'/3'-nucleotidase SurE [Leptospira fluminis]TGK20786.1 5'/3'-nucleotidase SurE [Leptospira fluminis]